MKGKTTHFGKFIPVLRLEAILIPLTVAVLFGTQPAFSQDGKSGTTANYMEGKQKWAHNPFDQKVFIENKGQFDNKNGIQGGAIQYGVTNIGMQYYFTSSGWTYRYDETKELTEPEIINAVHANAMSREPNSEEKEMRQRVKTISSYVHMNWTGANPGVRIVASDPVTNYFNYVDLNTKSTTRAKACRKITYINLYPGIDVEYAFPENKPGIKYTLILHPGADVSVIKMLYSQMSGIAMNEEGNVEIKTPVGDIIDHAPVTHYEDGSAVVSSFELNGETVSFRLGALKTRNHKGQAIIIDPWTTDPAPGLFSWDAVYDVEYDNAGNVYVYGGGYPFAEIKINSAGALQWSSSLNFYNQGCGPGGFYACYGDFAVDASSGYSYLVEGFNYDPFCCALGARVGKLDNTGALIAAWIPGFDNRISEMWRIVFNNCTKQAIIAGGGISDVYQACILDTTLTNMTPVNVLSANESNHDFTLLALDNYSNCFMATSKDNPFPTNFDNVLLKCSSASLTPTSYVVPDNHSFLEVGSVAYVDNVSYCANGYNGMAAGSKYLYTYDGSVLKKWNKNTGILLNSVVLSGTPYQSGGIDVNDCDNTYIGVGNSILQIDSNLNTVGTIETFAGNIYDVKLGPGNMLYTCGEGFASSFSLGSNTCGALNLAATTTPDSCLAVAKGTATVNPIGGVGPFTYLWSPSGKTTQSVTGLAPGTYSVTVTDLSYTPCSISSGGSQTLTLTIPGTGFTATAVPNSSICPGDSVQLFASPSGDTYQWVPSNGTLSNTGIGSPWAKPAVNTTYTVTVTSPSGCTSTATVTVNVNAIPPAPTITKSVTGDTLYCTPGYTSYQWYRDSLLLPGKTTDTLIIGNDKSYFSVVVTNANGCSNQAVYDNRSLPIELISFDAIYNGKTVDLNWSTANEINNDFFTVAKTKNSADFMNVVNVKGAGNSYGLLNYHAVDDHPLTGVSYYRLKQTDFDGKYHYSQLVAVDIPSDITLQILAVNPASAGPDDNSVQYFISSTGGNPVNIVITDAIGRVVVSKKSAERTGVIDFSEFAHGVYLFRVVDGAAFAVRKFVY